MHESIATTKPDSVGDLQGAAFARYYDLDVADERDDIDTYVALASAVDGPILELACGTGRVCIPLAEAGHRVVGVDRDIYTLERARAAWERLTRDRATAIAGHLEVVHGDITDIRLGQRFDLVILAFNSLLLLAGDAHRAAALTTIRDHLSADGRAVLEIWQPSAEDLELYDGRVLHDWTKIDPETGDRVTKSTIATYDDVTRRAGIRTIYDVEPPGSPAYRLERIDEVAFVSREGLLAEMEATGLQVQAQLGTDSTSSSAETYSEIDRLTVVAAPIGASVPHQSY